MHSKRRDFIKQAGMSAAAFVAMPAGVQAMAGLEAAPRSAGSPRINIASSGFLSAAFEEQQAAAAASQAEEYDMTWTERVTGKQRAVFDVPEVEGGVGVFRAGMWSAQCMSTLKLPKSDISTVIVIRHNAIPMVMKQEFWSRYNPGKQMDLKDDNGDALKWNPMLPVPGEPEPTGMSAAFMLDRQIREGAIVLGCGMAFRFIVAAMAEYEKITNAEAQKQAESMLIPGIIMQPSGFFANVIAQQTGCAFVYAV